MLVKSPGFGTIKNSKLTIQGKIVLISEIDFEGKVVRLHDDRLAESKNSFTVIVGKNGSGKSRLLRKLTHSCVQTFVTKEPVGFKEIAQLPRNVIAVSTSPFDRFPMASFGPNIRNGDRYVDDAKGYYFYQGLRGLYTYNLSVSYMVQIIGGVIRALMTNEARLGTILDVLDYLGFEKGLQINLTCEITRPTLERLAAKGGIDEYIIGGRRTGTEVRRLLGKIIEEPLEYKEEVAEAIGHYVNVGSPRNIDISLTDDGFDAVAGVLDERFITLMECGVLRLKLLALRKKGLQKPVRINDASSGEQCVVMTMLGIAARIKDGSLICIDEPEICLHPEWQERYIQLLMSTFRGFHSCQFVIATHSPQIVSRLGSENCYVLDLQNNTLQRAEAFNNRSADFQLAQVFNAPGFKNEYMMRELLSIVTTLSSGKSLSPKQKSFIDDAKGLKGAFSHDDPVLQLTKLVEEALKVKGARGE
ncbi:AAA family ATPase [Pseudomonas viridiflava]|uniref:AAA family ATPase n=1 Tax=Pseudomonas viridiflava TaxID=33069 RepID=UPI002EBC99D4|nr:AAA family ATPase [Pseudomonas viridiflava]